MKHESAPSRFDLRVFALSSGRLAATDVLGRYGRIVEECQGRGSELPVVWSARGEARQDALGQEQIWLHLHVDTTLPLVCQRCLEQVQIPVSVDRSFRFVVDEEAAAAQDDAVEEDVLALTDEFDLHQLIEDELVLALPLIARHEVCPGPVRLAAVDAGFDAAEPDRPNPFAQLAQLKRGRDESSK